MAAETTPVPPTLHATLLGRLRLAVGDRPIPDAAWARRAERSLLLLLLATPGHALPRDRVLDLLWPEAAPASALNALYKALHALRRVLEPELRSGRASAYVEVETVNVALRADCLAVDVDAFEAALARAAVLPPAQRRAPLAEALALYGGDLLADEPYADWPVARREGLRRAWEGAVIQFAERVLADGDPHAAMPPLETLLASDETVEEAHRLLMRVYDADGQRHQALRQYDRCRQVLRDELGAEPSPETEQLYESLRVATAPVAPQTRRETPVRRPLGSLPAPPTPLVGRERDVEAVQDLLLDPDVRLVTLTGTGGIGKTRLALEAAGGLHEDFPDGVGFVSLAPLRDPSLVPPAIGHALGLPETRRHDPLADLIAELRERTFLLVLDNCEHLLAAMPGVADLLAACPDLKVLATSRQPLHLRGEHVRPVAPLALPNPRRRADPAAVASSEAVALLVQTLQTVRPGYAVTPENAPILAEICGRLDGLPLAIELAAARMKFLTPQALLARLGRRLDALTGGPRDLPERQQTLRATLAWSYDLLTPCEQHLFRRLAVFAGGCQPDAVEWVMGDGGWRTGDGAAPSGSSPTPTTTNPAPSPIPHPPSPDTFTQLCSLADKGLVRWLEVDEGTRVAMLETVREFALEQLVAAGDADAARRAHAAYFLRLVEAARPHFLGPKDAAWTARLEAEHDNLRVALDWTFEAGEAEQALRMGTALWYFWEARGYLAEGIDWVDRAIPWADAAPRAVQAAAFHAAGGLANDVSDFERAIALQERALALQRELGDRRGMARTLDHLGNVAQDRGEYDRAVALHAEALALSREVGDRRGVAAALGNLGAVAFYRGRYDEAERRYAESLELLRAHGDERTVAVALQNLGAVAHCLGDLQRSLQLQEEGLEIGRKLDDSNLIAFSLVNLGELRQETGDLAGAVAYYQEGLALLRQQGQKRPCGIVLGYLATAWRLRGDVAQSLTCRRESLTIAQEVGDRATVADGLEGMAALALHARECAVAARWLAAADALRATLGAARQRSLAAAHERWLADLRAALGAAAFSAAWDAGQVLPPEDAVAEALRHALPGMAPSVVDGEYELPSQHGTLGQPGAPAPSGRARSATGG